MKRSRLYKAIDRARIDACGPRCFVDRDEAHFIAARFAHQDGEVAVSVLPDDKIIAAGLVAEPE